MTRSSCASHADCCNGRCEQFDPRFEILNAAPGEAWFPDMSYCVQEEYHAEAASSDTTPGTMFDTSAGAIGEAEETEESSDPAADQT